MSRVILAIVSTAAALVFLLSFKTHSTSPVALPPPSTSTRPALAGPTPAGSSKTTKSSPAAHSKSSGSAGTAAKTVTGDAADTLYGPVQVQITVKGGKVTAAQAIEYATQDPRDAQINGYAIPMLNQEAVSASSAQIDTVSGATYTSNGYITSLQSALDKAGV